MGSGLADEEMDIQLDPVQLGHVGVRRPEDKNQPAVDTDAKSDTSFDPLFDDDPDSLADEKILNNDLEQAISSNAMLGAISEPPTRSTIPPPKNAPPLLDSSSYAMYSPNILMTAYIDGQVVLWDRRAQTSGKGVGRLWMSEKTPPWCLSVSRECIPQHGHSFTSHSQGLLVCGRYSTVCRKTERHS